MVLQVNIPNETAFSQITNDELMAEVISRELLIEDTIVKLIEDKQISIEMILGKLAVNKFMSTQPK